MEKTKLVEDDEFLNLCLSDLFQQEQIDVHMSNYIETNGYNSKLNQFLKTIYVKYQGILDISQKKFNNQQIMNYIQIHKVSNKIYDETTLSIKKDLFINDEDLKLQLTNVCNLQKPLLSYIRKSDFTPRYYFFSFQDYNLQHINSTFAFCFKLGFFDILKHVYIKYIARNCHLVNQQYTYTFSIQMMYTFLRQIRKEIVNKILLKDNNSQQYIQSSCYNISSWNFDCFIINQLFKQDDFQFGSFVKKILLIDEGNIIKEKQKFDMKKQYYFNYYHVLYKTFLNFMININNIPFFYQNILEYLQKKNKYKLSDQNLYVQFRQNYPCFQQQSLQASYIQIQQYYNQNQNNNVSAQQLSQIISNSLIIQIQYKQKEYIYIFVFSFFANVMFGMVKVDILTDLYKNKDLHTSFQMFMNYCMVNTIVSDTDIQQKQLNPQKIQKEIQKQGKDEFLLQQCIDIDQMIVQIKYQNNVIQQGTIKFLNDKNDITFQIYSKHIELEKTLKNSMQYLLLLRDVYTELVQKLKNKAVNISDLDFLINSQELKRKELNPLTYLFEYSQSLFDIYNEIQYI